MDEKKIIDVAYQSQITELYRVFALQRSSGNVVEKQGAEERFRKGLEHAQNTREHACKIIDEGKP
jgi:hypothetical protein